MQRRLFSDGHAGPLRAAAPAALLAGWSGSLRLPCHNSPACRTSPSRLRTNHTRHLFLLKERQGPRNEGNAQHRPVSEQLGWVKQLGQERERQRAVPKVTTPPRLGHLQQPRQVGRGFCGPQGSTGSIERVMSPPIAQFAQ